MCGRFVRTSDTQTILHEFDAWGGDMDIAPSYNIAPSQTVAAIVKDDKRHLLLCRWGFVPPWAKNITAGNQPINARAETIAINRAFSTAFKHHRCLIPANGFYEWRRGHSGKKTPVFIRLRLAALFAFAGLYSSVTVGDGSAIDTCAIITTTANAMIAAIHDRMPVIIHKENYSLWLGQDLAALPSLLKPYHENEMTAFDVSMMVNSPKNNSSECIEPI
ncbi:MAG: SOS response-associated peptidase [Candidatus Magnetominusculus sp. LBB02]|nr:SOS response-associated peptidase [Candidatus Magnetominusculus sp. LBB02]